jgi:hypothetical protein
MDPVRITGATIYQPSHLTGPVIASLPNPVGPLKTII